ncbi:hypothetical protein [Streptomyces sp. NBC_00199]|uniref:hypothetical protein n=1 Tax=Streptomyces sp. NBC_00199 TaxID=2975678 RepID=UPI0022590CE1|nr:hypothetical protein [Streptomyces sp. NBC_00199]MCX5266094.1 hypothetical protein [Streptomyces sp. NBC_00199]
MDFPTDPLGLRGQLRVGQVWQDITADLYAKDPITHKRGRPYRSNAADPSSCSASIRNTDGKYTRRNPNSPLYGQIGRNTPFRIGLPGGPTTYLEMTGAADLATTPDVAALDITGDLDIRWEGEADWYAPGAQFLIGKWGTTAGTKSYGLVLYQGFLYFLWTADGTTALNTWIKLPTQLPRRTALRATLDADNGAGAYTMRMYWDTSLTGTWAQLGGNITGSATTTVFASTAPLTIAPDFPGTPHIYPMTGKTYRAEVRNGIAGTVVAAPDFTTRPAGKGGSFTDSAGRVWTLTAAAEITNRVIRMEGEVPEWPTKWTRSKRYAWAPIEAAGILRRLSQGTKPLDSTLRRRVPSGKPLAYWPMEDGRDATQFYSPIAGVRPMTTAGLSLATEDSLAGSSPLPTIREGGSFSGTVPAPAGTATAWHCEFVFRTAAPTGARTVLHYTSTGTVRTWQLILNTTTATINGYDVNGDVIVTKFVNLANLNVFGQWCRWQLYATQTGSTVSWTTRWITIGESGGTISDTYTGTVGRITRVVSPVSYHADFNGMAFGHLAVFTTANTTIYNSADIGFAGETAAARMTRLCTEEGVPLTIVGDAASTARVGAQRPADLLTLLRSAAEVDGGVFGETSDRRELWYRTRADLYSQAPALTLDYATGQIAEPFEPVEDDQVRNEWSVTRTGGSTGVASLDTGALSLQDPPDGIGYYPDSKTLPLYSDDQTEPTAGWLLHLSTWDESRYPSVTVLLHECPQLIPYVLALRVGDKIRLTNLPVEFTGTPTADLLVDGWSERFRPRTWEITFTCAPAGPWQVAAVATHEDFEDATYVVPIASGGALPWTRTQTRYNSGTWSLRSGAITNNQSSDAVVTIPAGSTELRFWYRVSSEASGPGFLGDRFIVLLDGAQALAAQGEVAWSQAILDVTGKTTVTFRYVKDNSAAGGEDAAWIDDLTFTGQAPYRADTGGSQLATDATATATTITVTTTVGRPWTTDPIHLPFDVMCGGEVMRVTAITGATSPQTFTVIRSRNGIAKAQTANTPVSLAQPAIVGL